jgi:hypothetical protein
MSTLTKIVVNCETGEEQILNLTPEEVSDLEASAAAYEVEQAAKVAAAQAKAELKASAKAKLIAGQPLTAEEADVLVI